MPIYNYVIMLPDGDALVEIDADIEEEAREAVETIRQELDAPDARVERLDW